IRNVLGGDIYLVGSMALLGPFRTVDDVTVHRSAEGSSASLRRLAASSGFTWFEGRLPRVSIALLVLTDIAWATPTYRAAGGVERVALGVRCATVIYYRFVVLTVVRLAKHVVRHPSRSLVGAVRRLRRPA